MTTNIQKSAVIVRLNIKQWGGEKIDRSVSDEVASDKKAASNAGKYVKSLFAGNQLLKDIAKVAGKARNINKAQTLPYLSGQDLLPVTNFDSHAEIVGNYKDIYNTLVGEFCHTYEKGRDAQKLRLGDLWNADDYPPVEVVRERFQFTVSYQPLPDGNTFDKMFGSEQMERLLIDTAEAEMQSKIDEAMHDLWSRLIDRVDSFADAMRRYQPKTKEAKAVGTFKDSIVQNIRDICDVLPRLNLTGDADLNNYCDMVRSKLAHLDAGDLRDNDLLRKNAADDAQSILDAMSGYGMAAE